MKKHSFNKGLLVILILGIIFIFYLMFAVCMRYLPGITGETPDIIKYRLGHDGAILLFLTGAVLLYIYYHGSLRESNRRKWFASLILFAFVVSNIQIIIFGDFQGFYSDWNYGDFSKNYLDYYSKNMLYDTNYPPLAMLFYRVFNRLLPVSGDMQNAFSYMQFMIIVGSVITITFLILSWSKSATLALACIVTGPMLFAIQRLNIVIIAFIGTLIFFLFLDNQKYRWLSLLSLSIAINIKLYPIVYLFVLFKKKRYKDLTYTIIMSVALFFVPYICAMSLPTNSLLGTVDGNVLHRWLFTMLETNNQVFYTISLRSIMYRMSMLLGFTGVRDTTYIVVFLVYIAFTGLALVLSKSIEIDTILLGLMCIFIPSVTYWYVLIFLELPFLFLVKNNERDIRTSRLDIVNLVLLLSLMVSFYNMKVFVPNTYFRLLLVFFVNVIYVLKTQLCRHDVESFRFGYENPIRTVQDLET